MRTAEVRFGQWAPDQPDLANACTEALNVYPTAAGYGPFETTTASGDTAVGVCVGSRQFKKNDGSMLMAGGTLTDLFIRTSSGVTASSLGLTVSADDYWRFERFKDLVFAVALGQATHYLTDLDTDTAWSAAPGSIPKARAIAQFDEFLVLGNVDDGTAYPYRVQWSPFNDPTGTWGADAATQAGVIDLEARFGPVMALANTRTPLAFQEYAITRFEYVGPPQIWDGARDGYIERERGAVATGGVIVVGDIAFFAAHDGFFMTNGTDVRGIGAQMVNDWFLSEVSKPDMFRIQGAVNWDKRCVVWAFPSEAGGGSTLDRLLIYSWQEDRWSHANVTVDMLVESRVDATSMDDLDATYPDLDAMTISLDAAQFKAGARTFAAWLTSGANTELNTFDGAALQATINGGEMQPEPGRRVFINGVYPLVENADEDTTARLGYRGEGKGATVMFTSATSPGAAGYCPQSLDRRYVRPSLVIPAGANWDKATGAQIMYRPSGVR